MRKILFLSMFTLAAFSFTSCSNDDDNTTNPDVSFSSGCYIANQGGMNENDGTVQYYDFNTGLATGADAESNIFALQNGEMLGDLVQDLLWIDDKLFVTVSGSQKIEILDLDGKRLRQPYRFAEEGAQPRMMATDGTNVYVTNYDGNVYVYSASTAEFVKKIPVGIRPEGISVCNGYLVVNNAGDLYAYNGTVSVINLSDGEIRSIAMTNPYTTSLVCNDEVYIIDAGNYVDIPSAVYRISPEKAVATSLGMSASAIAAYEDRLYYVNTSYLPDWTPVYSPLCAFDVVTGETTEILPSEQMTDVYSLSVNPENGDIFVGYAQYGILGTMRMFAADGTYKGNFEVGYYTSGARFENK